MSHFKQYLRGEIINEQSGIPHTAYAIAARHGAKF